MPDFYARGPHPFFSRRLNEFRKMLLVAMTASVYLDPRDGVPERVDQEVNGIVAALMTYTPTELAGFLGGGRSPEAVADIEGQLLAEENWAELTECFPFGIADKAELSRLAAHIASMLRLSPAEAT
jgi:hypothetical protein